MSCYSQTTMQLPEASANPHWRRTHLFPEEGLRGVGCGGAPDLSDGQEDAPGGGLQHPQRQERVGHVYEEKRCPHAGGGCQGLTAEGHERLQPEEGDEDEV